MSKSVFFLLMCLFMGSCTPRIVTSISRPLEPISYKQEIIVFGLYVAQPPYAREIGTVKIGDTGFTTDCGWVTVIEKAKMEARKAGGNAIKITRHIPPSIWGSTCHRIEATILWIDHFEPVNIETADSDTSAKFDYALLHFYRPSSMGALVSYDLHLGSLVICRAKNNWKETIKIEDPGPYVLWAQTETKTQLPLILKKGKEYYIRCGLSIGFMVGHPTFDLMDEQTGQVEYQSIKDQYESNGQYKKVENKNRKAEIKDLLVLNSGAEIPCQVVGQDKKNVYFIVLKNSREIRTSLDKKSVKEINIGAIQ